MKLDDKSKNNSIKDFCDVAVMILNHQPDNAATRHAVRVMLRVAVNKSTPNYKGNNNKKNAQFISEEALKLFGKENNQIIADHAIPLSLLYAKVFSMEHPTSESICDLVNNFSLMVLITKEEDGLLNLNGLKKSMPKNWDETDKLARYKHVGITLTPIK